jgi:MFS transporter, CP family, cyanate transporter
MNAPWFTQPPAVAPPGTEELEPSADAPGPHGGRRTMRDRLAVAVLSVGLLVIALNLRIGVASVGPVLTSIRGDLGLSATVASLLTTIPVVAFGTFAFLAPWLTRRLGMHQLLGLAMAALAAGIGLRRQPSLASLFAGTIIVGAAIAIANVLMPAVIKQDFPRRVGPWMGVYSTSLFLSAAIADGLTVPLLPAAGGHWRPALALWAFPAVVACLLWLPQFFRTSRQAGPPFEPPGAAAAAEPSFRAILGDPVAIAVTSFMGLQCTGYYVTLTWLPTLLREHGMNPHDAGWMLSYSAFPGIAAALVSPALARRIRPTWVPVMVSVLCYAAAYAGLAVAPTRAAYLWMTILGLGQGASISLALSYIAWRSPDARHTAQVSTMAQGFGYLLASLGPIGIGAIHAASRGWTVPLAVLAALLVPQLIAGALASRERLVLAAPRNTEPRYTRPQNTEPQCTDPRNTRPEVTELPNTWPQNTEPEKARPGNAASRPVAVGGPVRADKASLRPWDNSRDWFTPARGTPEPTRNPTFGWPMPGGENHAGSGDGSPRHRRSR